MQLCYNIPMKRSSKIILTSVIILTLIIIGIFSLSRLRSLKSPASIISTTFPGYDFARAVTGDSTKLKMLVSPGTEIHNFEPTPQDIIDINNSDLFIYVGGESDEWVERLLENNEIPTDKTLRLIDIIKPLEEEHVEGMEEEHNHDHHEDEHDEHIWTSPVNAAKIVEAIKDKLTKIYPSEAVLYQKNAEAYVNRLFSIDYQIRGIINNSNKKELIFGDRFPFRYFSNEYGLDYFAAFPGCSEQTEASSSTIAFLIDKVKADDIKVVLKIELTDGKLANTIAEATGAKVLELNSAHNISLSDFDSGLTYIDIMEQNLKVLEEALK